MTFTLSPPVRYAALLGLLATVLVGGGLTMLGHKDSSTPTPHVIKHHPFGPAVKKQAGVAPTMKHAAAPATQPGAKVKPKTASAAPKSKVPPKPPAAETAALAAGFPAPIAYALGQHPVVVVTLYNPYSEVDGIAFAEARAGAQLAHAGFVPLNVLSAAQVEKLTEQLGLLPDPGLLIYTRQAGLVGRLTGFVDRDTVAQAAQNAAHSGT